MFFYTLDIVILFKRKKLDNIEQILVI